MIPKDKVISTLTNAAYGLAGLALYSLSSLLLYPAIYLGLLMLGSGFHHYHLKSWSRKWDYMAMYAIFASTVIFGTFESSWVIFTIPLIFAVILYVLFKCSRVVIGVLTAILLLVIWIQAGAVWMVGFLTFISLPFTFNMLGDSLLSEGRDYVHGLGWHPPTAGALMFANIVLYLSHIHLLPF